MPNRRLPAEWEPQSAVQLTLPHAGTDWAAILEEVLPLFYEIAGVISRFQKVILVAPNAATALEGRTETADTFRVVQVESDDTWARDHGGITVFENGKPVVLDFTFNGWGQKFEALKDDRITRRLFDTGAVFQAEYEKIDFVLEGGGIESDGEGTLLTTAECLLSPYRNPQYTKAQIEALLCKWFGLKRVLWLHHGYLAGDDTDSHIDTLARFCDANTIAYVSCPDPADEHYEALAKMEAELKTFKTLAGTPYRLVPLPWPDACYDETGQRLPATYANFLIINNAVLVPIYKVPQDEEALRIFRDLFPDREIIGINCRPLIWQHGSLHCITMQYPAGVVA